MPSNEELNLVDRLKIIRKELNINQIDFAKSLGLKQGSYSDIERGKNLPSREVCIKIARSYNIDLNWLLLGHTFQEKNELPKSWQSTGNWIASEPQEVQVTSNLRANTADIRNLHLFLPAVSHSEYINGFPKDNFFEQGVRILNVPWANQKARTIEITDESMSPSLSPGDFIVCEWREKNEIKTGHIYALISTLTGIAVRIAERRDQDIKLIPTNSDSYYSELIPISSFIEIWEVKFLLTSQILNNSPGNNTLFNNEKINQIESFLRQKYREYSRVKGTTHKIGDIS